MNTQLNNYLDFNDYELLYMIRQNDEMALFILLKKYEGYLRALLRDKWNDALPGFEKEDLMQIARLKVIESAEYFNEEKGCTFCTYMTMCVMRRLGTLKKTAMREKNAFPVIVSLDGMIREDSAICYMESIQSNQQRFDPSFYLEYSNLIKKTKEFVDALSEAEKKIWSCITSDLSYAEASAMLKMKEKTYDNAVYKLRKKFNSHLKQTEFD